MSQINKYLFTVLMVSLFSLSARDNNFKPKQPTKLTEEELKKPALDRIKEKFIGDIPEDILGAIFCFEHRDECLGINERMLLYGNKGAGKAHLIKVMAQELQLPILVLPAEFFADKYVSEAWAEIQGALKENLLSNTPVLIFIDDMDQVNRYMITFLTDKLEDNENVFIMASATNRNLLAPPVSDRFIAGGNIKELTDEQRKLLQEKFFKDKNITRN